MKKGEHISLLDSIIFLNINDIDEKEFKDFDYEKIAVHIGDCVECNHQLLDVLYLKKNFEKVWAKVFPIQNKVKEFSILLWIKNAEETLTKEAGLAVAAFKNKINEGFSTILEYDLTYSITTHGTRVIGNEKQVKLKCEDSIDLDLFEIKLSEEDNKTINFNCTSNPGYENVVIIGKDINPIETKIIETVENSKYHFSFEVLKNVDEYLLVFY